jgi:hypothetical protein
MPAPTTAPMPIPAFAPVDRPDEGSVADDEVELVGAGYGRARAYNRG